MSESRLSLAEALFDEFVAVPPEHRSSLLAVRCAGDAELHTLVARMLENDDSGMGGFLRRDAASVEQSATAMPVRIGSYEIIREIGRGGAGVVYEARQENPSRLVALKVIGAGLTSPEMLRRFLLEAEILGCLQHPGIAQIYESGMAEVHSSLGLPSQAPYFAMELVQGEPINRYCDRERLGVQRRLELFRDICIAVQHAHQKGIIHRDLKPSNILVVADRGLRTLDSSSARTSRQTDSANRTQQSTLSNQHAVHNRQSAVPKVIDFGIAKVTAARRTDITQLTERHQFMGTPEYMSPEQANPSDGDIDTRSDVYALGIILYELLTGSTPLADRMPRSAPFGEIQRVIRDEEPPRPSQRLDAAWRENGSAATSNGKKGADSSPNTENSPHPAIPRSHLSTAEIAANRAVTLPALIRAIRGDLDWIVMKCLEKDRLRRYETVNALAEDVSRFLNHEPVLATPPSAGYALRKFVRRNRGPVVAGALVASTLLVATGVSIAFGVSEAQQRRDADSARNRAQRAEAAEKARADELEQVVGFQAKQLSGIDAQTMGARIRINLLEKARAAAGRAMLPPEEVDARIAELERLIAGSDFTGLALDALDENVFRRALTAIDTQFSDQPLVKARLLQTAASTLVEVGLFNAATGPQEEALAIRRRELGDDHPDTLLSLDVLGNLQERRGRLAEAERYLRDVVERRRRVLGDEHADTLASVTNLGALLRHQNKTAEAVQCQSEVLQKRRRLLGDEHPHTLVSMNNLGLLFKDQGKFAEAESYFREALEKHRRVLGEEHPHTLILINNMGFVLQSQGKLDEAELYYREALDKRRRLLGGDHPDTVTSLNNLGSLLHAQGKLAEAERCFIEALERIPRVLGERHRQMLVTMNNMAFLLRSQGRLAEAETYCRDALERHRELLGDNDPSTLVSMISMGNVLCAQEKYGETLALLAPAEAAAREAFTGGTAVRLGHFLTLLGWARRAGGEFVAAESNLTESQLILSEAVGATNKNRAASYTSLVQLYDAWHAAEPEQGHDTKAAEWRAKLKEWQASTQPAQVSNE